MNKRLVLLLTLFLGISLIATAKKPRIFTIGDSTMADYDLVKFSGEKEQRGWCQLLPEFLKPDVILKNAARGGRSSKSFYYEVWKSLRNELKPGDYVFIQFGHNDEKNDGLDTGENDTTGRGTAPWSQYQRFLTMYVKETRERGATPVLFTSVTRRYFENGIITRKAQHDLAKIAGDSTLNYVLAMKHVARELSVPLIDMTASTKKLVESYGPERSKDELYVKSDNTHIKIEGARQFAKLAVAELKEKGLLKNELK
jgi:lysophospholipase L1-like esterase